MTWNKVSHHHTTFLIFFLFFPFFFPLDHGIMDFIFFIADHDKITCHELFIYYLFLVLSKKDFGVICYNGHVHMYCIYTRYIDACIYQGLNLRPHGSTPRF
jgi:hypothetical protein